MSTNYEAIAEEHRRGYGEYDHHFRIYRKLYADKTHFVYELVQNAEDKNSSSRTLKFMLSKERLLAWNDGTPFGEKDVRAICSIGQSEKDLTQIGTFGIGFKSVYAYTDSPEIYSGDEHFRIQRFVIPERIDTIPPEIEGLYDEGKTVFHLPFKAGLTNDIERLGKLLGNLDRRTLLFLRNLETIEWQDENNRGSYRCSRHPHETIPNAWRVELQAEINGEQQPKELFLVFRKDDVRPSSLIISDLLCKAEDEAERKRIQSSAEFDQPIEVAFRLEDGRIVPLEDHGVLFAYLPTVKETHLRFLIQGRYQTTPARDNIPEADSCWNQWLIQETAHFLPKILEQLKGTGLLTPAFFDILPIESDGVPNFFKPISEAINQTLREGEFIPTDNDRYGRPDRIFHPHAERIRMLLTERDISELTGVESAAWLHSEMRDTKEYDRRFQVAKAVGVKTVDAGRLMTWLSQKGQLWLGGKDNVWLRSLYIYLHGLVSERERVKGLPLIRLANGEQVSTNDQPVFFPPQNDDSKGLEQFLRIAD